MKNDPEFQYCHDYIIPTVLDEIEKEKTNLFPLNLDCGLGCLVYTHISLEKKSSILKLNLLVDR